MVQSPRRRCEMAKKFMYVCLGILALVTAFHIGAQYGAATIMHPSETGILACSKHYTAAWAVLLDSGDAYAFETSTRQWEQIASTPIPLSEIKFWASHYVISNDNELWVYYPGTDEWYNAGTPGGGMATHPTTWSRIKAEFGE
jgi:hypothetical protein